MKPAIQETKHTAYTVLSYPVRASHPNPDGLSPQSNPPAGGQPTLCHGSAGMVRSAAAGLHSPSVHDPQTTAGPQAFFILPPAVRTRFPLKRVPAHVPGTASGFRVHVLNTRATEVAVAVAVAAACLLAVAGRGAAGGTHPRSGVGRHLVWHLHRCSGAAQRQQHTRGRLAGSARLVCR